MVKQELTAQEMFDKIEALHNYTDNEYGAGFTDASAHVGGLINGIYTPEVVAEVQADMLDPNSNSYTVSYAEAYTAQWNRMAILIAAASVRADGYGADSNEYMP